MREQYHLLSSPPFLIELHESDKLLTRHALIACPYIFPLINYEFTLFKTMGYILCSYLYDAHRKAFKTQETFLHWYNCVRPHRSLNFDVLETPEQAFIRKRRKDWKGRGTFC